MESRHFVRLSLKIFLRVLPGLIVIVLGLATPVYAQLAVTDLTEGATANGLAQSLAGAGITISNVTFTGAQTSAGTFSGGNGIIGFADGIILSSGNAKGVIGPNASDSFGMDLGQPGDASLDALLTGGLLTQDAAVLEFDFIPQGGTVSFLYVFASDEYNEFVGSVKNDIFAFFVNGTNCALVGTAPVSINTINNGGDGSTIPPTNPTLFINNDLQDGGPFLNTEMDGLTTVLTCTATVNAGATNRMKLAIADTDDGIYDANVFIQAGSLSACQTNCTPGAPPPTTASGVIEGAGCSLHAGPVKFSSSSFGFIMIASVFVALRLMRTHSRKVGDGVMKSR